MKNSKKYATLSNDASYYLGNYETEAIELLKKCPTQFQKSISTILLIMGIQNIFFDV